LKTGGPSVILALGLSRQFSWRVCSVENAFLAILISIIIIILIVAAAEAAAAAAAYPP